MKQPKDQSLEIEVVGDRIVISIGVETLKHCHNALENDHEPRKGYGTGYLIEDANGFARDVVQQFLQDEREDGSSPLTDLFDKTMIDAVNNGSIHTKERFEWFCNGCEKGMSNENGEYKIGMARYCSADCYEEYSGGNHQ